MVEEGSEGTGGVGGARQRGEQMGCVCVCGGGLYTGVCTSVGSEALLAWGQRREMGEIKIDMRREPLTAS